MATRSNVVLMDLFTVCEGERDGVCFSVCLFGWTSFMWDLLDVITWCSYMGLQAGDDGRLFFFCSGIPFCNLVTSFPAQGSHSSCKQLGYHLAFISKKLRLNFLFFLKQQALFRLSMGTFYLSVPLWGPSMCCKQKPTLNWALEEVIWNRKTQPRASGFGILGLDSLLSFPRIALSVALRQISIIISICSANYIICFISWRLNVEAPIQISLLCQFYLPQSVFLKVSETSGTTAKWQ